MEATEALGLLRLGLDDSLRAIPFDPERRGDSVDSLGGNATNGERASAGGVALACFCVTQECHGEEVMADVNRAASMVDLTEAPEEALADLLANLMHYCHKEGVSFSEALVTAVGTFTSNQEARRYD